MPTIKTFVDNPTYDKLVKMRKEAGLPSISALFLTECKVLTNSDEAAEIVRRGLKTAEGMTNGFEFRLRDLFSAAEWDCFTKGARLRAGRLFLEKVASATYGIRAHHKSASNQQIYVVAASARAGAFLSTPSKTASN